jgi:hypothetical protein
VIADRGLASTRIADVAERAGTSADCWRALLADLVREGKVAERLLGARLPGAPSGTAEALL